jgi:ParB-like chromosome segregation protein Spo0J
MTNVTSGTTAELSIDVDVKLLKLGMSPRFGGQDIDHAQALAFRLDDCPPILVERSTSTVIDGVHRVLAARMLGRTTIAARYFEGTHEEAFLEAVRSNIAHGKPLTLAEREAAAKKVLGLHSDWSDRLVGDICGLSDKTIGRLRKTTADIPQLSARVGRDGRQRPTDPQPLRNQIATALREKPDANLEELAASLSTSPSTVRDVRKRLQRGDDPTLPDRRVAEEPTRIRTFRSNGAGPAPRKAVDWSTDQAILALPGGRELAEWLQQTRIDSRQWEARVTQIPLGRIPNLIEDAESRALEWTRFAKSLEERFRQLNRRSQSS